MKIYLDMKTVFVLLVLGHLFTVLLITAYRGRSSKDPAVDVFYAAKWFQSATWGMLVIGIAKAGIANFTLLIGVALETIAILMVFDGFGNRIKRFFTIWTAVTLTGYYVAMPLNNTENIRIAIISFSLAIMLVFPAYRLMKSASRSALSLLLGYVYLILAAGLMFRTGITLLSPVPINMFKPGLHQSLLLLALYTIMVLGNMGFVLLSKEQADREMIRLASYDDLTGALNRRTFIHQVRLSLISSMKKNAPVSFILMDIDNFKTINDTLGHDAGDKLLQEFAVKVQEQLKADDLLGRYGGDEFAIFLPEADETTSDEFIRKLRKSVIDEGSSSGGNMANYTISFGVVTVIPDSHTIIDKLYKLSDDALYTAKKAGRNRASRSQAIMEEGLS